METILFQVVHPILNHFRTFQQKLKWCGNQESSFPAGTECKPWVYQILQVVVYCDASLCWWRILDDNGSAQKWFEKNCFDNNKVTRILVLVQEPELIWWKTAMRDRRSCSDPYPSVTVLFGSTQTNCTKRENQTRVRFDQIKKRWFPSSFSNFLCSYYNLQLS